jgi:hypothetical protein
MTRHLDLWYESFIVTNAPVEQPLRCPVCRSSELNTYKGEMTLVLPKLENLHRSPLFLYADVVVCSGCGFAQFSVPDSQRKSLTDKADRFPIRQHTKRSGSRLALAVTTDSSDSKRPH